MTITSPDFDAGGPIPDEFSKGGANHVPELRWSDVPDGTRELVVMMHDPDAPLVDGFTHWVVVGIDPAATRIGGHSDTASTPGVNSMGDAEYMGPAPPPGHGIHHYYFHLFALDTNLVHEPPLDRAAVLGAMDGHIIEQARVVGTYSA
ncbi:MAG: YbhB/YbcL family Raf kinase inhibitor-like protein [Microthrixaceae bacterium]